MTEKSAAPADPLGEALHFLRMSGTFYCRSELTAPWALALPARKGCLSFHVVMSGRCLLEVEGAEARRLQPGDLALVPHGEGHHLASEAGVPAARLDEVRHEHVSDRYAIHVEASMSPQTDWMQSTLRLMAAEARELRPGGETVITRLADILVIQAIRSWIDQDPAAQTGWLGALQDEQIGRAIALIHRDPARPWTLASLASEVAMSRSAFAARFAGLVGEPAMHYVTRWRMQVAHTWLQEDAAAIGEMASRLGYQSEAAFNRAFKRFLGVSPGTVRRGAEAGVRARATQEAS